LKNPYYTPHVIRHTLVHPPCNMDQLITPLGDMTSLLMYRCLLSSSATVKMDYEENIKNARYATNDDTPL
jgi:hypothetical protein